MTWRGWMAAMRGARVILVAALLLGACNGGGGSGANTTLPPRVSTTASTVPDYSVPAVIDVAYVEKVMAALDHVYGDAIRILARERKITQDFLDRLAAIYGDRFFRLAQDAWVKDLAKGLPDLKAEPGNPTTDVVRVERSDAACLLVAVVRDYSATRVSGGQATPQHFVALTPLEEARDPKGLNPTPWIMSYDGFTTSGTPPLNPCNAS